MKLIHKIERDDIVIMYFTMFHIDEVVHLHLSFTNNKFHWWSKIDPFLSDNPIRLTQKEMEEMDIVNEYNKWKRIEKINKVL